MLVAEDREAEPLPDPGEGLASAEPLDFEDFMDVMSLGACFFCLYSSSRNIIRDRLYNISGPYRRTMTWTMTWTGQ